MASFKKLLRQIPVSVNNFYGDPMLQWANTKQKLQTLADDRHTGPVGLITKGIIRTRHVAEIKSMNLNVIPLISISELNDFEGIGNAHRYENIRLLEKSGVSTIGYLRPFIPPFNTGASIIRSMVEKIADAGGKCIVASGFRGDEGIVSKMSPAETSKWVMRVKLMPDGVYDVLAEACYRRGVQLFLRTSCGVSWLSGMASSYNPYWNSPNLARCDDIGCPLRDTCGHSSSPYPDSVEFLGKLGYDVSVIPADISGETCSVTGSNRLDCPSCCTTCYMAVGSHPHIRVGGKAALADLAFIRFITGMLAMRPGVNDDGRTDIGNIRIPKYPDINFQVLNTWMPWAHTSGNCYGCRYCVVSEYYNENCENIGFSPVRLADMI